MGYTVVKMLFLAVLFWEKVCLFVCLVFFLYSIQLSQHDMKRHNFRVWGQRKKCAAPSCYTIPSFVMGVDLI